MELLNFDKLKPGDNTKIAEMSKMATEILREHYDPILGKEQNDYMLELFQSKSAIAGQLESGYIYYFVKRKDENIGFLAYYPRGAALYLSKFYLYLSERRKGYSHIMLDFLKQQARSLGLKSIELNVNKHNDAILAYERLGFEIIRQEKNDIGHGYYMDDYVYSLSI